MGLVQQHGGDLGQPTLARGQGRLIDQVGQLSAAEARCALCQQRCVHVLADRLLLHISCFVSFLGSQSIELSSITNAPARKLLQAHQDVCFQLHLRHKDWENPDSNSKHSFGTMGIANEAVLGLLTATFPGISTCRPLSVTSTLMHAALSVTEECIINKYPENLWAAANLQVVFEDLQPTPYIWQRHHDMAVKAAWPGESCIKVFLHVGGCHDNDALIRLEAVHLQEHGRIQESVRATYSSQREGQPSALSSRTGRGV